MNWVKTIDIKPTMNQYADKLEEIQDMYDDEMEVEKQASTALNACKTVIADMVQNDFPVIAKRLRKAKLERTCNRILDELYDAADQKKIFLGI